MSTFFGLMRRKVMPMGVENANTRFQRMTEDLHRDVDCAQSFVDDLIVASGTLQMTDAELVEVHFIDLCKVLDVLCKHQLTCNGTKKVLFATEVSLLDGSWAT